MFTKPTLKTGTGVVVNSLSLGAGVKLYDGVSAVMPESTSSWKRYALAGLGLFAAACVKTTTPVGENLQLGLIGFGGKAFYDEVQEKIFDKVAAHDSSTPTGKFMNAVMGLGNPEESYYPEYQNHLAASMDWIPSDQQAETDWNPSMQTVYLGI
jgi:hypothetical protein